MGLCFYIAAIFFMNDKTNLIFCEKVDGEFNAINSADTFPVGNVTLLVKSGSAFKTTNLLFSTYKIEKGTEQLIDRLPIGVNPEWNVCVNPGVPFFEKGKYKIVVSKKDKAVIAEGIVRIQ